MKKNERKKECSWPREENVKRELLSFFMEIA
jgi:hypothetical protein